MSERIHLSYFTDFLCVWAYVAQIRLDELRGRFGDRLEVSHHFVPVFGATAQRIEAGWADRGGFEGFGRHVCSVCAGFPHVELNTAVWRDGAPATSGTAHLVLNAVQVLEDDGRVAAEPQESLAGRSLVEELAWRIRCAFFRDCRDIGRLDTLLPIAAELGLPADAIEQELRNGRALARLHRDLELRDEFKIEGSPTYYLNEGRQKLYGNVGYRILEVNVQELLDEPTSQASWC